MFKQKMKNSVPAIFISNSFCTILNFPPYILKEIRELLTYEDQEIVYEIRQVQRLKKAAHKQNKMRMFFALKKRLKELSEKRIVCWLLEDKFPTGHLDLVSKHLKSLNYSFEIIDTRKKPDYQHILRWYNDPPKLRYYQQEMVSLADLNCRGIFESACGTGKTLVMAYIIKNKAVNSLIVVPSKALQEQTFRTLSCYYGKKFVSLLTTSFVKSNKKPALIQIATIQTLVSLQKQELIQQAISDVDLLLMDEFHHFGANGATNLLKDLDHIYYRFGVSATALRNDSKTLDMLGVLSNKLYTYLPKQATAEGYLSPIRFRIYELDGIACDIYMDEYEANYCENPELLESVYKIIMQIPKHEQILILVDRKDKVGAIINKFLNEKDLDNTYISGDNKKAEIINAIEKFNDKEIRILIGSTVIGEGVDIRSTEHLLMCRGGKSQIQIVQAVGRSVRLFKGKSEGIVTDILFKNTNFLEKHLKQRLEIYKKQFAGEIEWME